MRPLDYVFYHSPCTDGFTGAWAIWKAYGDTVQYIPLRYGDDLPVDVTGKHILFVDVSQKAANALETAQIAASLVVLDHHKSAEIEFQNFLDATRFDSEPTCPYDWIFDMSKSGARLAWNWAQGHKPDLGDAPFLVDIVEDRDLWLFKFHHTKALSRYINSYDQTFQNWDEINEQLSSNFECELALDIGEALDRAFMIEVRRLADLAIVGKTEDGVEVPVGQASKIYSSDLAHELLKRHPDAPFAAVRCFERDQEIWSLRSEDHRQDVRVIAEHMGGGGHRNAAGFQIESLGHEDLPFSLEDAVAGEA